LLFYQQGVLRLLRLVQTILVLQYHSQKKRAVFATLYSTFS
jgi:hypothetical protein